MREWNDKMNRKKNEETWIISNKTKNSNMNNLNMNNLKQKTPKNGEMKKKKIRLRRQDEKMRWENGPKIKWNEMHFTHPGCTRRQVTDATNQRQPAVK
jgi:hypothetical protein